MTPLEKLLLERSAQIERILEATTKDLSRQIRKFQLKHSTDYFNKWTWKRNKQLQGKLESIIGDFNGRMTQSIQGGSKKAWELANVENDILVKNYTKGIDVPEGLLSSMNQVNLSALDAFLARTSNGWNLSDRVWKLGNGMQTDIQSYLGSGIAQGKSATKISQDLNKFLKNQHSPFRRVKNADGKMVWSKPAKEWFKDHPVGRGVYRNMRKNAMRLARTETNAAYRTADHMRRQQLPFVTGFTVHLSSSHLVTDICDDMVGDYPKNYVFVGFHSSCMCFVTTKKLSKEEFRQFIKTGFMDDKQYVDTIPKRAEKYIDKHKEQFDRWKRKPEFIADNFTQDYDLKKKVFKHD